MAATPDQLEKIRLGQEAKALLEHPMIAGALHAMEELSVREFTRSAYNQSEVREQAYRRFSSAQEFRALLTKFITTGRLEEEAALRASAEDEASRPSSVERDTPNERRLDLQR